MLFTTRSLTIVGNVLMLWMMISALITIWSSSLGLAIIFVTLILGAVQYFRTPPVHDTRVSDRILDIFRVDSKNLKKNIVLHKAGAGHAPENTMEAVREAIRLGAVGIEIDLDITKDDVGVLIHGPKVDDTTDGSGYVTEYTFDQLQELNAAAKFDNRTKFPTARIPALEACVEECIANTIVMFIDCKGDSSKTVKLLKNLYLRYPELYGLAVICSFYPAFIFRLRQADPKMITALTHRNEILSLLGDRNERNKELWKRIICPPLDALLAYAHRNVLWYLCGNSFFLCCKDNICLDSKKHWEDLGVHVIAWTVNDPLEQEFMLKHLKIPVITDMFQDSLVDEL